MRLGQMSESVSKLGPTKESSNGAEDPEQPSTDRVRAIQLECDMIGMPLEESHGKSFGLEVSPQSVFNPGCYGVKANNKLWDS